MTAHPVISERVLPEFSFPSASAVSESVKTTTGGAGTVNCLNGRMPVFVEQASPAVIRLTHSSCNKPTFLLPENDVSFPVANSELGNTSPKLAGIATMKITNNSETLPAGSDAYIKFINHDAGTIPPMAPVNVTTTSNLSTETHNSLLKSESNLRLLSRQSGKHVFSTSANENPTLDKTLSDEEEGLEQDGGRCNSGVTMKSVATLATRKTSSKKGKRKKRSKSSYGSRSKSGNNNKPKTGNGNRTKVQIGSPNGKTFTENSNKTVSFGVAGLGVLESALCKPVVLHKHPQQEKKNGAISETSPIENTHTPAHKPFAVYTSKVGTVKSTSKSFSLPQMTNNYMVKSDHVLRVSVGSENISASRTYGFPYNRFGGNHHEEITRITKVYLSDKHSGSIKDCGMEIPCAPPVTPTPDQLKNIEYIPSMNDIRSQRAVKVKLQVLEKEAQKRSAKKREEMAKLEKQHLKDREKDLKIRQRIEIYALNKVMTELENSRFYEFCQKKGISIS